MSLGPMEILGILILALVVFGPKKLPEMGRTLGKAMREFKSVGNEIQDEITKVTDEIDIDPEKREPEKKIKPPKSD